MTIKEPRKIIIEALMKNPEGLTLLSLAEVTGLHRHTATKYVHELIGAGVVYQRSVGAAKLCYLKKKIETETDEKRVLDMLRKKRKGSVQMKLLIAVVVLSFLLSESVIIAYENSSFINNTNFSNTSPVTSSLNNSDLNINFNITENINSTQNSSVEPSTNETEFNNNGTVGGTNGTSLNTTNETIEAPIIENTTNVTEPVNATEDINQTIDLNLTFNETFEENETVFENITEIIESITSEIGNITSIEPILDVKLLYPQKIIRGESLDIRADLENSGYLAKNVVLNWLLPAGFNMVSGNMSENCGDLDTGGSCYSEISVMTNLTTGIGLNEIRVVVDYEE
ncbi:MAG: helix-turn-helix domain-containing protein [Candidatus Aenigmatarchaeota archaeon]